MVATPLEMDAMTIRISIAYFLDCNFYCNEYPSFRWSTLHSFDSKMFGEIRSASGDGRMGDYGSAPLRGVGVEYAF